METKNRILFLLEANKMSIHALAIQSGVAPSTIKNILYGKSKNPGIVTIKMLCDGFGISLYEFFDTDTFRSTELENI
ncbi:MAG: helix-turn-helix domain-containing protein [Oscillospiraceae bacterium]|nr:helix-turn-helix domain-containing protein [Oscillospiraceae bacterium]